jgi:hypothetical protein
MDEFLKKEHNKSRNEKLIKDGNLGEKIKKRGKKTGGPNRKKEKEKIERIRKIIERNRTVDKKTESWTKGNQKRIKQ